MTLTIELPVPPKALSPNARVHYHVRARAVKAYRLAAHLNAVASRIDSSPSWEPVPYFRAGTTQVTWYTKTKRKPDADNALSSLKAAWDGITDSGFLADDRGLTHQPIIFLVDKHRPRVVLRIEATE